MNGFLYMYVVKYVNLVHAKKKTINIKENSRIPT